MNAGLPHTYLIVQVTMRQASQTRERILKAAIDLFWEKGYTASGIAEILQRARANSGSFYFFFHSKEDLLLAVLARYQEMLYPVLLEPIWTSTRDPVQRIFKLLDRYRELILSTECTYGCPIGRLALEIDPAQTPAHEKIAANFEGWSKAVAECLGQAQETGKLPRSLDRKRLACFVLTVMEGGVMQSRSYRSVQPFDDAVAELRRYFRILKSGANA